MAQEIETKVLEINTTAVRKRLDDLGAQKIQDTRLVVDWYRLAGIGEEENPWFLRIRTRSDGSSEVTWKARSDFKGVACRHKEINFSVEHPEELGDLFEEIGLEKYAHQEKDRTSWTYKDWRFDLDQYPDMPAFIEIEGISEEHVEEGMQLLEIQGHKTWAEGERTLIQNIYKLDWYHMIFAR